MTRTILSAVAALLLLTVTAGSAFADITMTFEQFRGGLDQTPVGTFYKGISFESGAGGSDWIACLVESGTYNASSWPSGEQWGGGTYWVNDYVSATTALDYTGDDGIISFDNKDATYVELNYAANAGGLYLEAYDENDNLLDSAYGAPNLRYINGNESGPGTLRVDSTDPIAYVIVHDSGNYWTVDNITTDASGITVIPAPAAILLGMVGLGVVGWLKRRVG